MISSAEAPAALDKLLDEAGFSADAPSLQPLYSALQRFMRIPVACAEDNLLCQWGSYSWAPDVFEFDFTRQFVFEEDGEYAGMQQLHCTLAFPKAIAAGLAPGNCWASEHSSIDAFWAHVETLPAFLAVRAAGPAQSSTIRLEDV
jgi:hypothetical protein